jgi:hypothetical protein
MENIVVTSTSSTMFDYAYKYIGNKTIQATSMHGLVVTPRRLIFIVLDNFAYTTRYHNT